MDSLRDMLAYWRRPQFFRGRDPLTVQGFLNLGRLLAFTLGAVFALMLVTGIVLQLFNISRPELSQDFGDMITKPQFLLMAVVFAPLVEEILFRSWMGVEWGILLILPLLLWLVSIGVFLSDKTLPFQYDVMCVAGLTTLMFLYVRYYLRTAKIEQRHTQAVEQLFPYVFWGGTIVFGLVHMSNFDLNDIGLLGVIIILPQIFVGAVLGFIRMRHGLIAAMLFHAGYNGVLVSLSLLVAPVT